NIATDGVSAGPRRRCEFVVSELQSREPGDFAVLASPRSDRRDFGVTKVGSWRVGRIISGVKVAGAVAGAVAEPPEIPPAPSISSKGPAASRPRPVDLASPSSPSSTCLSPRLQLNRNQQDLAMARASEFLFVDRAVSDLDTILGNLRPQVQAIVLDER